MGACSRSAVSSWQLVVSPCSNHRPGQQFPSSLVDTADGLLLAHRPVTMPTPVTSHFSLVPAPSQAGSTWDLLLALLLAGEIIAWVASRPARREIRSVAPTTTAALNKPVGLRSFLIDWAPPETAPALGFLRVPARCSQLHQPRTSFNDMRCKRRHCNRPSSGAPRIGRTSPKY